MLETTREPFSMRCFWWSQGNEWDGGGREDEADGRVGEEFKCETCKGLSIVKYNNFNVCVLNIKNVFS